MLKRSQKAQPKKALKASTTKSKVYLDYFDVQANAPRRVGAVATTKSGVTYKLMSLSPLVWKKK